MIKQNIAWVSLGLQILIIVGGIAAYIFTLPSKDYIDSTLDAKLDAKIKPLEVKIEALEKSLEAKIEALEKSLEAGIKELQDDVDQLNQNYIDHLVYHVGDAKP